MNNTPLQRPPVRLPAGFDAFLQQCSAYDLLESAVAVVDAQGALRYANPAFSRFNSAVRDSVGNLARYPTLLECPELHSRLVASLGTSRPEPLRHVFYYAPKIQVELSLCLAALLSPDDKIAGAMLTLGEESIAFDQRHLARSQDAYRLLAERIKNHDRLNRETQQLLRVLLKDAPVAMLLLNEKREIVQMNHAAEKLFGTSIADMRGRSCERILPCCREHGAGQEPQREITNEEIEVAVPGKGRRSLLRSVAVLQRPGAESMIVEAFVDVTESKAAEKAKSEFMSIMSHELRTPLNAILGFGQLLEMDADPRTSNHQEAVKHILSAGHQLLGLVNDLLDLSRFDNEQLEHNFQPLCIADIASICVGQVSAAMADKNHVTIENRITDASLMVQGDDLRLRQVMINFLSNAVKYNKENGRVILSSTIEKEGRLRIEVHDTGAGIANDKLSLLFTAFERLDQKHGTIPGVGIGLHISKRLVEAMHGKVGVESTPGKGSTFWFDLPLADEADGSSVAAAAVMRPDPHMDSRFTVLYIEDNPVNVKVLELAMQSRAGVTLLTAGTAEEGLVIAEQDTPDLILMDIHLPGMDGIAATSLLKKGDATRHIPVVALSADAMKEEIDRALSSGCEAYLTKPIKLQALYDLIDGLRAP